MGKGDKKTKRGKITIGSYGKKRRRKEKISAIKPTKVEVKAKPARPTGEVAAKPKATPKPNTEEKPKVETKEKAAAKPKPARPAGEAEVKEKVAVKPKEKATPKKTETKDKPKKEKEE